MLTTLNNFQTELTFSIESEEDLIRCFRLRDQKKLVLPANLTYPLNIRSYFSWRESSGVYTYLIFKKQNWDMPRGVAFKRVSQESAGGLCSWCNNYGSSEEISMMSITVNSNTSFSYILCQNIRCIEKIEESAALNGKSPDKWIEQLYEKMGKLFEGLSQHTTE